MTLFNNKLKQEIMVHNINNKCKQRKFQYLLVALYYDRKYG